MSHSGCNGGKQWQIIVKEKYAGIDVEIFNSCKVVKNSWPQSKEALCKGGFVRPQKANDIFEDWLWVQETFNYENHALYVNKKWFSLNSIGKGLRKIGEIFNQPLFLNEKEEKK